MNKKLVFIAVLALVFGMRASAQMGFNETNNLFYHTLRTPQSNLSNAAFFPTNNSFYLMLPGVDFQFGSPLALNNVIYYDKPTQRTLINLDTIFHNLSENNTFRLGADVNILGFGFKMKNMFFTFNTRMVNFINAALPVSAIRALVDGNVDQNGAPVPEVYLADGDILNVNSYLETALGAAFTFDPLNLTVGARIKLLYGIANVQTDNTKIVFNTNSNFDSVSASVYYEIQSSTFAPYDTNKHHMDVTMGNILGNTNMGLSFDIGAKYEMGPFTFSFAINDLTAGIHWKNNVTTWRPEGGQGVINFNGVNVTTILNSGDFNIDSLTTYLRNQISNMTPTRSQSGDYWFSVPTKINLGASYSFAKIFRAGLLLHGQLDRGLLCKKTGSDVTNTFRFNTTLSIGANLFNWAEVIAANSLVYDGSSFDPFNPGVGLVLTPATIVQLYLMADYISNFYLVESKAVNIKFGLNILIGKGDRSVVTAE